MFNHQSAGNPHTTRAEATPIAFWIRALSSSRIIFFLLDRHQASDIRNFNEKAFLEGLGKGADEPFWGNMENHEEPGSRLDRESNWPSSRPARAVCCLSPMRSGRGLSIGVQEQACSEHYPLGSILKE
jgi:hypothetical protein